LYYNAYDAYEVKMKEEKDEAELEIDRTRKK